jgi:glycosyltransferase involved in cell wall biosynthesis
LKLAGITPLSVSNPLFCAFNKLNVLHVHWAEQAFWSASRVKAVRLTLAALIGILILKLRGVKIVWSVHNLVPHEGGSKTFMQFLHLWVWTLTWLIDGFVTLSPSTINVVRESLPNLSTKPATFIWIPPHVVATPADAMDWRKRHAIPDGARLFAYIGIIRPYKGVDDLIACFSRTKDSSIRLVIAGRVTSDEKARQLETAARSDGRIILKLGHLSDSDLSEIVLASNAVVLPFRKILHSGTMIFALSCGRPVITPHGAYSNDLRNLVGAEWMLTYKGEFEESSFSDLISPTSAGPNLDELSPLVNGLKIRDFYISL